MRRDAPYASGLGLQADRRPTTELWMIPTNIPQAAIPWKNFSQQLQHFPPQAGDILRGNLNRHGGKTNMQYSQWSDGGTPMPAFHAPGRFGKFTLAKD